MVSMHRKTMKDSLLRVRVVVRTSKIATFRLEHEDDYEYEFQVLSTRTSKVFAPQT